MKVLQIFLVFLHQYEAFNIPLVYRPTEAQIRKGRINTNIQNRDHEPHRQMAHYRRSERQRQMRPQIRVHISDNDSNYLEWKTSFTNTTALDESQTFNLIIPITETSSTYSSISTPFRRTSSDVKISNHPFSKSSTSYKSTIPSFDETAVSNDNSFPPSPNDITIPLFNKITAPDDSTIPWFSKTTAPSDRAAPWFSKTTDPNDRTIPWISKTTAPSDRATPWFSKTTAPYDSTIPWFSKTHAPSDKTILWSNKTTNYNGKTVPLSNKTTSDEKTIPLLSKTPTLIDKTLPPINKTPHHFDNTSIPHDRTTSPFNKTPNPNYDRYLYFSSPSSSKSTLSFNESSFSVNKPLLSPTNKTENSKSDDEDDDIEENDDDDEYFGSKHEKAKHATTNKPTVSKHQWTTTKAKINFDKDCGIDNSPDFFVNTGRAKIETYPWLGVLYYRTNGKARLTTPVVLVTKQLVLATAMAIHEIPKQEFRSSSRVVIGHNCSHKGLGILEYNYHPEYRRSTYSSLVVVQLNTYDVNRFWNELRPICGPPKYVFEPTFHAMILPGDCKYSRIEVHEMDYVTPEQCTNFYGRTDLDVSSIWPTRVVCSKARSGGGCVWADGTVLALKQKGRWHLMGFGISGPGCQAPSRFVDYTDYQGWVTKAVRRIGSPAITRLDINKVVIRKTEHIQRYGRCDIEEIKHELYTDAIIIVAPASALTNVAQYNLTLSDSFDYSCVSLEATYDFPSLTKVGRPRIRVHAFCLTPTPICQQAGFQIMLFDVTIFFKWRTMFKISIYGRDRPIIDQKSLIKYANKKRVKVNLPWDWEQTTTEHFDGGETSKNKTDAEKTT